MPSRAEAVARERDRCGGMRWEDMTAEYERPGVIFLAAPDRQRAEVYPVVTGEDRGSVWMRGLVYCGWHPESPTCEGDPRQSQPPRTFLRWYEDWLDAILPEPGSDADG